jgi:hypothetical protein
MAIGRISGPMLKADLLREGVDLAFETDLLYLDVNNKRIGVNKSDPEYDLDVKGITRSPSIEITSLAAIADITISGNTISSSTGVLELGTEDTVVYQNKLKIDDIEIQDNEIRSINGSDIEFRPDNNAVVEIFADTNVYGNVFISGNITTEGDIFIGDNRLEDNVIFNAKLDSDLIPTITNTYDLGSTTKIWKSIYVNTLYATQAEVTNSVIADRMVIDDIEIDNNEIRTIAANTDLRLSAPGAGRVRIENFAIKNNVITNVVNNSITVFSSTNNGYFKIDGARGFVVPVGSNLQRPEVAFREAGMIRFNTDDQRLELFNGSVWGSVAGPQAGITAAQAQDIAVELVLMLG